MMHGRFFGVRRLLVVCLAVLMVFGVNQPALAVESAEELPRVVKWVNGMAVGDDGSYLQDTWAVDETGVSEKGFVLVDGSGVEVLRVKEYPGNIQGGDSAACKRILMDFSLVLPEGAEGDVYVTLENAAAKYSLTFSEKTEYQVRVELYPGTYEIVDVELAGDLDGNYLIQNGTSVDTSKETVRVFDITADRDENVDGNGGVVNDGSADDNAGDVEEEDVNGMEEKNRELLWDTVITIVLVVLLLGAYLYIKRSREKQQEIRS